VKIPGHRAARERQRLGAFSALSMGRFACRRCIRLMGYAAENPTARSRCPGRIGGTNGAHSGFVDFNVRDGFDGSTGSRPGVWYKLSDLPAGLRHRRRLHRMRLYLAGAVRRVGIGPRRSVHRQPLLRGCKSVAGATRPAASPRPLSGRAGPPEVHAGDPDDASEIS
jgi:hypothetical protein